MGALTLTFKQQLLELMALGIRFTIRNNKLTVSGPIQQLKTEAKDFIKSKKQEIMTFIRQMNKPIMHKAPTGIPIPLSFAQHRLWLTAQIHGESNEYNIPIRLQLEGKLNQQALLFALTHIVQRHHILRTVYRFDDNQLPQQIVQTQDLSVRCLDLSDLDLSAQACALQTLITTETEQSFSLANDLMVRATLVTLAPDQYRLLLTLHHIAADGWSMGILTNELSELYQAFIENRAPKLVELTRQYVDYAYWQHTWLQGEILTTYLSYWERQLLDLPLLHQLPLDMPRPSILSFAGKNYQSTIQANTATALLSLCQQQEATLFMALQAAFSVLLSRYSGETDIVMGTVSANREQTEVNTLIGFFVNTLVLRSDLSTNPSFLNLLIQSKATLLDAYAHQEIPFEQLVETLVSKRSANHHPLFQILIVMQNNDEGRLDLPGLSVTPLSGHNNHAKFDLKLSISPGELGSEIGLTWNYNQALFNAKTIQKIATDFTRLLANLVDAPQVAVLTVPMLDPIEIKQQFVQWNGQGVVYPQTTSLHQLFTEQAGRTPDHYAVAIGAQRLTFAELQQQTNQLAHYLDHQHIGQGDFVGLVMDGSVELLIAMLSVLSVGACYVPLATNLPHTRLTQIITHADMKLLLVAEPIEITSDVVIYDLNAVDAEYKKFPTTALKKYIQINTAIQPAYMIYTSGSTGVPKGVLVPHRGVIEYCYDAQAAYYNKVLAGSLVITSPSFDLSVPSLFLPLLTGGMVEFAEDRTDLVQLWRVLVTTKENKLIRLTPSHIQTLNDCPNLLISSAAHVFVIGGEPLKQQQAALIHYYFPYSQAYNHYGPSESIVGCSYFDLSEMNHNAMTDITESIPIGRPLANARLYVLNSAGGQVPTGSPGELYIGREQLALGYHQQETLTAERFISPPLSIQDQAIPNRLYRSGDIVRWQKNGLLDFIGRVDDQVKIRGYRIELREIESCLCQHNAVQSAFAIIHHHEQNEPILVAYYVAKQTITPTVLSEFLLDYLPDYMLPTQLIAVDHFPITANGKINHQALPLPTKQSNTQHYIAANTETESVLCALWQEILAVEQVGIHDNFFQLGGHSILITRLFGRIAAHFAIEIPIKTLFTSPTVYAQAQVITQTRPGLKRPPLRARIKVDAEIIPLSFAQERLWFLEKINGPSPLYSMPQPYARIEGDFNLNAFEQALNTLIARHEILRTTYQEDDQNQPIQVIHPAKPIPLPIIDLCHLSQAEQQQQIKELRRIETQQAIDITQDNMLRVLLVKCSTTEHILMCTLHHIASDGWSMAILANECSALYFSFVSGTTEPLPPLTIQYADYALWQRNWLQGEVLAEQINYWVQKLEGAPKLHSLPIDYPRPLHPSFAGNTVKTTLNSVGYHQLRSFCQQQGATLFMGLNALFAWFLGSYSNTDDIIIGTVIANREQQEITDLIGFFANTLILRSDLSQQPTLNELTEQSKANLLEAYAYQQVPFEQLVSELAPDRAVNYNPMIQIVMVLQNNEQTTIAEQGLQLTPLEQQVEFAKFDLVLNISEDGDHMNLSWSYQTELFAERTIARMAKHFLRLINQSVQSPDIPLSTAHYLSAAEQQLLCCFPQAVQSIKSIQTVSTTQALTVVELFEKQAEVFATKTALCFATTTMSYAELNQQANQLAHYLLTHYSIQSEQLIGIQLTHSIDLVIAILAVLKVGAAYVPLDPELPEERLQQMRQTTNIELILSTSTYDNSNTATVTYIEIDTQIQVKKIQAQPTTNLSILLHPEQLAYVLFTSGSTGKPKAVMVAQHSILNLVQHQDYLDFQPQQTMGLAANIGFDAMTFELWGGLLNGMSLVHIPRNTLLTQSTLKDFLVTQHISILFCTTALVQAVANTHPDTFTSLNYLLFGGEDCQQASILRIAEASVGQGLNLIHVYGPTENTTFSLWKTLDIANIRSSKHLALGQPLQQVTAYVLGERDRQQLMPIGVVGQLYLGGAQLAKGYLDQPEITAECFVENPFYEANDPQSVPVLYKTGDRVRRLENNDLEFMGRDDDQIKIRGFRIELGEIESALLNVPEISKALVIAKTSAQGNKQLIAYYQSDTTLLTEQLRQPLSRLLPNYYLPTFYIAMDDFPLTHNGKINQQALPEPELNTMTESYLAPRNELETKLAILWQELLEIEQVSVYDNFFRLGGHSLLATRLVAMLSSRWGINLPLRAIFNQPILADQASIIVEENQTNVMDELQPIARTQTLPASFAQKRLWLLDKITGQSTHYHIPITLNLQGILHRHALEQTLDTLLAQHEVLRTTLSETEEHVLQIIHPIQSIPLPYIDLRHLAFADQDEIVIAQCAAAIEQPFDLSQDRMMRALLLQRSDDHYVLQITFHHIAVDGWSLGVLTDEFNTLYRAFSTENPLIQSTPIIQYADFAHWQHHWLQGEALHTQLHYWKTQLADLPTVHQLPLDKPRPAQQRFNGAICSRILPPSTLQALKTLCLAEHASLFMGIHAVFTAFLAGYSHERDIVVGTPIANREHPQLEKMIGFFVNMLVLRVQVDPTQHFITLLRQSRTTLMDAYAHQALPFELLTEALQPERDLSHSPLFQIMLVMQNNEATTFDLPNLNISSFDQDNTPAKYDLTLSVSEQDNGLSLQWNYNEDLFTAARITEMAANFEDLLVAVVAKPEQILGTHSLISATEQRQQLHEWQGAVTAFAEEQELISKFEALAQENPTAIALEYQGQTLSYGALNQRANQLGHYLLSQGVQPGELVGLYYERTLELIIGLLGILKAGAGYVPIDSTYPQARVEQILHDAQVNYLLTSSHLEGQITTLAITKIILNNNEVQAALVTEPSTAIQRQKDSTRTAYLIYTSGSTGQPKGVCISHRSVQGLLHWVEETYNKTQLSRVLMGTSISFDLSVFELWSALSFGGCVILVENILAVLEDNALAPSLLNTVPSALSTLLAQQGIPKSVKTINVAGEPLKQPLVNAVFALNSVEKIYNLYGPSEDTTYSTAACFNSTINESPTIGRPITNTQAYVLNESGQLLPTGCVGELYLGGAGVAQGYWQQTELTAEKFVQLSLPEVGLKQLYRTGDKVRWRGDGQLEFLGRQDEQIKIRGYRIELGEIEHQLLQCPEVEDAIILLNKKAPEVTLIAYLRVGSTLDVETKNNIEYQAQQQLIRTLPIVMQPQHWVVLTEFPLTANGKINRRALPEPPRASTTECIAPRTPLEQQLCTIWADVLKVESVGIQDNFFALGGHSLLAVKLRQQIQNTLNRHCTLKTLFLMPTVAQLAQHLTQPELLSPPATICAVINPGDQRQRPLFLIHPIHGDIACYSELAYHLPDNLPIYGLSRPELSLSTPIHSVCSIETLATEYLQAIKQYQAQGPYQIMGWSLGGVIALAMSQQLQAQGEKVHYLGIIDSIWKQDQEQILIPELSTFTSVERDIARLCTQLQSDPEQLMNFRQRYQLDELAEQLSGGETAAIAIILSGLLALDEFTLTGSITAQQLQYFAADKQRHTQQQHCITQLKEITQEVEKITYAESHQSIMQGKAIQHIAMAVQHQLLNHEE